jgi:hypothetical protein
VEKEMLVTYNFLTGDVNSGSGVSAAKPAKKNFVVKVSFLNCYS